MSCKYCISDGVLCEYLEKRPRMVETFMDSKEYVQNGWYYRCNLTGYTFNTDDESILEFQHCKA